MTTEQRDIILNEIIINNPKIRKDLLQACAGAQIDLNKLKEVLPSIAFVSKAPQGATGPRKAIVHRFWKPHTKYTLSTSTCRDILTWLSKFGELLTSDIDEFVDVVLKETRCPTNFYGALDLIDNHILAVLYTADIIKPSKLTLHRHFDVDQNPIVDNPRISVANALVYKKSRKEQNNNDYDLFEGQYMNIYEQLNKINDEESLNETLHLKESINADMIETDKGVLEVKDWDFSFIHDGEIMLTTELGIGSIELPNFDVTKLNSSLSNLRAPLILKVESLHGNECEFNSIILNNINLKFIKECIKENLYESKTLDRTQEEIETLKENTHSSSKSTKDRLEAAKQIITDLESKGFVNSDIAAIGTMIKETIDSRYPGYVSPLDRLRKKFPDLNI